MILIHERVEELAKQADEYLLEKVQEENRSSWAQVFAELIVKECINEIAYIGKANEVFGDRTDRGGLNHILWTTETAIEKIKQHFGVEE